VIVEAGVQRKTGAFTCSTLIVLWVIMELSRQTSLESDCCGAASLNWTWCLTGSKCSSCKRSGALADHEARRTTHARVFCIHWSRSKLCCVVP